MTSYQSEQRKYFQKLHLITISLCSRGGHDGDHVHVQFMAHPNTAISKFINAYKSASIRLLKKEFPSIREKLWKELFWSQSGSGKIFASILFEYEQEEILKKPESFLGMDYSMHDLYIDSEGHKAQYEHLYRNAEKKLSLMKIGSKNRAKQRIKVAKSTKKQLTAEMNFYIKNQGR